MTKIISYNVNGIRAALKKGIDTWIDVSQADIVCLQEIKAKKEQFDRELFNKIGYR